MKLSAKIALFFAIFNSFCTLSYAQIDTTWTFFQYRNNGTRAVLLPPPATNPCPPGLTCFNVDIRLRDSDIGTQRDYYLLENKTFSFRKSGGVPTDTYFGMAGFTSTNYTQGQLRALTAWHDKFSMNYRLIKPRNYPTNPNVEGGYPLIVMIHGIGERGNAGYWSNNNWNPNDNNPQAGTYRIISAQNASGSARFTTQEAHGFANGQQVVISGSSVSAYNGTRTISNVTATQFTANVTYSNTATADVYRPGMLQLLNNDHNLLHGGSIHQTAVMTTTPAGMVPDNPAMPARAFPGFVLFPQNLVGWQEPDGAENVVRIIRLLIKKYNINPNKIYIHGLSDGGAGAYRVMRTAPWLFSAILPMSAVNDADIRSYNLYPYMVTIPQWIFQGGTDGNPTPAQTQTRIQDFRNNGIEVRYTLYPNLGHGVWNNAYNESEFFSWMRKKDKSNIFVKFGNQTVCGTTGAAAELLLSQGFLAYQWEKDGVIIPGANAFSYSATLPGTYRARFSRKANPTESDWNRWSDPMVITESAPATPVIKTIGSPVMPTINPAVWPVVPDLVLMSSEKNEKYYWYRDGVLVSNAKTYNNQNTSVQDTLSMIYRSYEHPGSYTLRTADVSTCPSLPSAPLFVTYNTPTSISIPGNFSGTAQSPTSIFLTWADNSPNETGFEIWRRAAGENTFTYVGVTAEDIVSFLDTNLIPGTLYEYKLRAVSNTARSLHVPSEDPNINLEIETPWDEVAPTPPQNLRVTLNSINSISLAWDASTDNGGINQYVITYGNNQPVYTPGNETTFTLTSLPANTAYPITVQAEDFGGNLSAPSNQVIGTTVVEGLYYEHSTGAWTSLDPFISTANTDTPPIDWFSAEFTGKINNFNVNPMVTHYGEPPGIATQEDFYKIKFDGYILIPTFSPATSGNVWQFRTTSDDGSMLYTGGFNTTPSTQGQFTTNRRVNNDGLHGPVTVESGNVTLAPGYHRIVVLFNEYTGGQSLTVEYRRRLTNTPTWTAWAPIPDAMLRSGNYTPPAPLAAPTSVAATATGMTSVDLTWAYGGSPAHQFEVYRATVVDGDYTIVGRGTGLAFSDTTAHPSTTYYYKLKTISVTTGASSPFSTIATATTASDAIAPSVPTDVVLISKTFTNVAFSWTASTDNVGVTGYEILINDNPVGNSTVTSYMATGLEPGTLYNITVKAFDATGNKSAASSPVLQVTTNSGVMYYSKPTGALSSASTWGTNTNGTGTEPNLTYNGQYYTVANRPGNTTGLGGSLTIGGSISKLIVPAGTTLNVDNTISAKLEVQGNAVVNLNHATAPEFLSVSPTSTVNFNTYNYIPAGTYGNVNLTGTGNKNFEAGDITIMGNLTATNGIALKGVPGNASRVTVHGDITLAGTPAVVATDNALDLTFAKAGTQTVTVNGMLDLYKISTASGTNVNVVNGGSAVTINVGSPNGGGLLLANGTTLNLGNNHLVMKNAASINAGGETGKLAINGSNLNLTSSNTQNSNLYFDATNKTAGMVTSAFTGTGKLMVQSPVSITDGLKIKAGEVNSAGNITLASTPSTTAYLQEIEGNGSITGEVYVERWVSTARKYRYMSSAVADMTVANWQVHMPITGDFTGSSPNSPNPSMFYYVENDGGYKHYPHTGSNNSVTFERGRGYSIFNYLGNNPLTLTMTGNPYQGSVPFTLTPGSGGDTGWNLLGNPYASAIQWNNLASDWSRSGVSPVVHIPDNTSGTLVFRTWNALTQQGTNGQTDGIIAPGQAFWVQTVTANPTMAIHEKAKRTNTSTFFRESENHINSITVRLSGGSSEDEAYVILGEAYSDTYEPEADGMKLKNEKLNLSTRSAENVNLVFNMLSDSFCEKIVPLTIEDVTPGTYFLSFDNIENLVGVGAVELSDHFTGNTLTVTGSEPYSFAVTSNTASYGAGRFTLTFHRPQLENNAAATIADVCGGEMAAIQLTNTQPGVFYYASHVNDETPLSEMISGDAGSFTLNVPVHALNTGANSLVIRTGFKGCSNEMLSAAPLEFTYTPAPQVSVIKPYYSLCENAQVTLKAETAAGNSLRWYKDGQLIANQTSTNWVSGPIEQTTLFQVAAVINGCEGEKVSTYVEINHVPVPLIEFDGEVLEIVNEIPAGTFMQWYKDNEPMDAYDRGIKLIDDGAYSVLVSQGGCSKISDPFQYLITSAENSGGDGFNAYVYPNPATYDQLYVKIETTSMLDAEISLIDLTGRNVFDVILNRTEVNGVHRLNVSQDTTPGLYIMHIRQGSVVLQRKVMLIFK
ncbi:MAG: fibronectin type III domain-containing protein [Cyclobacteriaceae bacterium]|nr:fibronectin type III domain-containing protein [Cyclobacteriaceae bacterium]